MAITVPLRPGSYMPSWLEDPNYRLEQALTAVPGQIVGGVQDEVGIARSEPQVVAAPAAAPAPATPAAVMIPVPDRTGHVGGPSQSWFDEHGAGATSAVPMAPGAAPARPANTPWPSDTMVPFSVDSSRGESGADWAASHAADRGAPPPVRNSSELWGPGGGSLTQADFEGRANMRRMLEAAYGPQPEPFDPGKARLEEATNEGDIKIAEQRAKDPVAFARMQAGIPERAKMAARSEAAGIPEGETFYSAIAKWEDEASKIEAEVQRRRTLPNYKAATKEARDASEAEAIASIQRLRAHARALEQAMGITSGQTPSSLYNLQPGLGY